MPIAIPPTPLPPLPSYLSTPTSLIKLLKSSSNPPQPGLPAKVEIAQEALERKDYVVSRKEAVILDWVVEEWGKAKGKWTMQSENPLLDYRYHDLLNSLITTHKTPLPTSLPLLPILHSFFTSALARSHAPSKPSKSTTTTTTTDLNLNLPCLLSSAHTSFSAILNALHARSAATIGRAENWLECWGLLLAWVDKAGAGPRPGMAEGEKGVEVELELGWEGLVDLVGRELIASLDLSQNRKKITMSIKTFLPTFLSLHHAHPLLRPSLLLPLPQILFPLELLQSTPVSPLSTSFNLLTSTSTSTTSTSTSNSNPEQLLAFLPDFLRVGIVTIRSGRFSLYPPSTGERDRTGLPPEVYVSNKVRVAVLNSSKVVLDLIDELSAPSSSSSTSIKPQAVWQARSGVWQAIRDWGGYLEGESSWQDLVRAGMNAAAEAAEQEGVEKEVFEVGEVLVGLEYGACGFSGGGAGGEDDAMDGSGSRGGAGKRVLTAALTSNSLSAESFLLSILIYHTLTHTLPLFSSLITNCISLAITNFSSPSETYTTLTTGILTNKPFRHAWARAVEESLVGGVSRERGWGLIVLELGQRILELRGLVETSGGAGGEGETPSKKRKTDKGVEAKQNGNGGSASSGGTDAAAAEIGIVSRLLVPALNALATKPQAVSAATPIIQEISGGWKAFAGREGEKKRKRAEFAEEVVVAAVARLRVAAGSMGDNAEQGVDESTSLIGVSGGEATFEEVVALLSQAERTGILAPAAQESILKLLSADERDQAWSGRAGNMTAKAVSAAVWQNVAYRYVTVIDQCCSEENLSVFVKTLLSLESEGPGGSRTLTIRHAARRIFSIAEFWELPRIRAEILSQITKTFESASALTSGFRPVFAFLLSAPSEYLDRTVRNLSVSTAYTLDAKAAGKGKEKDVEFSVRLRMYLAKLGRDLQYLGTLENKHIDQLLAVSHGDKSTDWAKTSEELLSIISRELFLNVRHAANASTLSHLIQRATKDPKANEQSSHIGAALLSLPDQLDANESTLPADVRKDIDALYEALSSLLDGSAEKPSSLGSNLDIARSLSRYNSWRRSSASTSSSTSTSQSAKLAEQAIRSVLNGTEGSVELAVLALEVLGAEVRSANATFVVAERWMASWVAVAAAADKGQAELTTVFTQTLSAIPAETYSGLIDLLVESLKFMSAGGSVDSGSGGDEKRERRVIASLRGMGLLLQLQVPGTGKRFRTALGGILNVLSGLIGGGERTEVLVEALRVVEVIAETKPQTLIHQDIDDILLMLHNTLLPRQEFPPSLQPSTQPFLLSLSICNSLVRHRRDLIANHLPLLIQIHVRCLELFTRIRVSSRTYSGAMGKVRGLVMKTRPVWMGDSEGLGVEEAAVLAKAWVSLTARTTIRRMGKSDGGEYDTGSGGNNNKDVGTLVGELSKHAPAVLVSYTKLQSTSPFTTLPLDIRNQLEPGLMSLCEAVVAGGKAMFGGKDAMSAIGGVGEAFGLGEGEEVDAQREGWGEMWARWRKGRYAGQG